MPRAASHVPLNRPHRWIGRWLAAALLLAALWPRAELGAAPPPANAPPPADAPPADAPAAVDANSAHLGADILADPIPEATNHLGNWIWSLDTADKQTCHFWKSFVIPRGAVVERALLFITVDNGYTVYLDGREVGRGSDWRTITEFDLTRLLKPGRHVLAVSAFNDRLQAGVIAGLSIRLLNQPQLRVVSDTTWRVVPMTVRSWADRGSAPADWARAVVVGHQNQQPWDKWPLAVLAEPPLRPLVVYFWQSGSFQFALAATCAAAVCFCIWLALRLAAQSKAQRFLQVERARIARDIHDDLGARLTELLLLGEVAQRELPPDSDTRAQFDRICERARALAQAMDEVVWAINSRRDTLRDFVSYVCKYAQLYLSATPIRCRLDVEPEIPAVAFDLPVRRNLLLAVKEALNNVAKHSGATEMFLRIFREEQMLVVVAEDNGRGFDPLQADLERNGMTNMCQRMNEVDGSCEVQSQPGAGCRVVFIAPLTHARPAAWLRWRRRGPRTVNAPAARAVAAGMENPAQP